MDNQSGEEQKKTHGEILANSEISAIEHLTRNSRLIADCRAAVVH